RTGHVRLVMGDTDVCPWDAGTLGSRSIVDAGSTLGATAAGLREELMRRAAERLEVDAADLDARDGRIMVRGTERAVTYGDLVRDGSFIGVVASDPWTTRRAIDSIRAEWEVTERSSDEELEGHLRSHPTEERGWGGAHHDERGDVDGALGTADVRLERTYTTAYIAHAPLETRVAVAEWDRDRLTV